jgi:hypothetical protein
MSFATGDTVEDVVLVFSENTKPMVISVQILPFISAYEVITEAMTQVTCHCIYITASGLTCTQTELLACIKV